MNVRAFMNMPIVLMHFSRTTQTVIDWKIFTKNAQFLNCNQLNFEEISWNLNKIEPKIFFECIFFNFHSDSLKIFFLIIISWEKNDLHFPSIFNFQIFFSLKFWKLFTKKVKFLELCKMKITFEKFFGCLSLTIGGLVVGMLGVLASGIFFVLFYLFLINSDQIEEDPEILELFKFSKKGENKDILESSLRTLNWTKVTEILAYMASVLGALLASIFCFISSILLMRGIFIVNCGIVH